VRNWVISFCLLCFLACLQATSSRAVGSWTPVTDTAPHHNAGVMLLLPDGRVMVKTSSGSTTDNYGTVWDILTPDVHGSYINGTWTSSSAMQNSRLYFSAQVLRNGTVYVAGGEYGHGRTQGEIYYPLLDEWLPAAPLPYTTDTISDANSEILPNGNVLQAIVISGRTVSSKTYIYNPSANTYAAGPNTLGIDNESAWVKLPDNSILYINTFTTNSERYIPSLNKWIADSSVPVQLYDPFGLETGAAFLLPDGRAFFIGSTNYTAYYTPSGDTTAGSWAAGPMIPDSLGAPDAAASMMINGKILCAFSHEPTLDSVFHKPTEYFEFDYTTNTFTRVLAPDGDDSINKAAFITNMLCLPDGNILYGQQGSLNYYVYTPDGSPLPEGKPTLSTVTTSDCISYLATGNLFNGICEGAGYGDDWQMETNYPIIRVFSSDTVIYAETVNWNSTGVMRGSQPDTVQFFFPLTAPQGNFQIQVVANGNASDPIPFTACQELGVAATTTVSNRLAVYPNPARGNATVAFRMNFAGQYLLSVTDVYGRTVRQTTGIAISGDNTTTLGLNGLARGVYSVTVYSNEGVYNTQLVVE
jgi:Secretion system C-terminal sorting domain